MPLENSPPIEPPNVAYINDLNSEWPLGTDYPSDGDNHLRGIKNVLKRTFPTMNGPLTRPLAELNQPEIPSGTRMLFMQATAPVGWTRAGNFPERWNVVIGASTDEGNFYGGEDDPIYMDKVPSHTHVVSGVSDNQNNNHTHAGITFDQDTSHTHSGTTSNVDLQHGHGIWTDPAGSHRHNIAQGDSTVGGDYTKSTNGTGASQYTDWDGTHSHVAHATETPLPHEHTFTTGNQSQSHKHQFSTGVNVQSHGHSINITSQGNPGSDVWQPRYVLVIPCNKD